MVAMHCRFGPEMLARLQEIVGNAYGDVAIWVDPDVAWVDQLRFGPDVARTFRTQSPADGAWDCLVSIAQLWTTTDLGELAGVVCSGNRLFFVEPVAAFGLANRVQKLAAPLLRSRYGLDFECDLPHELRGAGMTPTSVDRFQIGRSLFTFAAGEARCY